MVETIGKRVSQLLLANDKSQYWLARKINTSAQTISNYLNEKRQPSIGFVCAVADVFGCSVDYLLGRTSSPDPWKATAMDEFALSEKAVSALRGESPNKVDLLRKLSATNPGFDAEESLQNLTLQKEQIHQVIGALLENRYFEDALLTLRRACEFETLSYQASEIKRVGDALLRGDDSVSLLPDGKYAVDRQTVSRYLKGAIVEQFEKAVDELVQNAERIVHPEK